MTSLALSTTPPFLDGVYLAVNAVPDLCLLVDCPSGCFFKCERIALNHDSSSTLFDPMGRHRIVQSGVSFGQLALGSEPVLSELARRAVAELGPSAVLLTQASPLVVTSSDLEAFAERVSSELGTPVRYVAPEIMEGDWLDGFEQVEEVLAGLLTSRAPKARASDQGDVAVVGYFADRLEEDHRASLAELGRLLAELKVPCRGILFDGSPLAELDDALTASTLLELPYAGRAGQRLAEHTGARRLELLLPIGIDGTVRWLERVAAQLGVAPGVLDTLLNRELAELVPTADLARTRYLEGGRALVAADPALATGLAGLLDDLGMEVVLVAARTRRESRLDGLQRLASRHEPHPTLLYDRAVGELREQAGALGGVDVVIGSSLERDVARDLGAAFVEIGYPSFSTHALSPRPLLGFAGARRLMDELANAVQHVEYERNSSRHSG